MAIRRVPVRTCCGCGRKGGKRSLVRIVRGQDGAVAVDDTGRAPGRGAYLCEDTSCWESGLGRQRLDRTLKAAIPPELRILLQAYAAEHSPDWATAAQGEDERGT